MPGLKVVPQRLHALRCFQWRRRAGLADRFENPVCVTSIAKDAVAAEKFQPRLFLRAFKTRDENGPDLAGHPHVSSAACRFIESRDVDHPDIARALGGLSQSG